MKPNIFVSYSRREVPFVNGLVADLENDGFETWVDYRNLVPGTTWKEQLNAALDAADTLLLVISEDAVDSDYVADEWQQTNDAGKRVILVIFQDVTLPDELKGNEWVDFRGGYKKALQELKQILKQPKSEMPPAPEKGINRPPMVWFAFLLSSLSAIISLLAVWTIWVPWMLLPLPYRIVKSRDYNFTQTITALLILPAGLWGTAYAISDATQNDMLYILLDTMGLYVEQYEVGFDWISIGIVFLYALPALLLIGVLLSPSLQRWGKPVATRVQAAHPDIVADETTRTVAYFIDHANQDDKIADEMTETLTRYGHRRVDSADEAKVVLVLVSEYNHAAEVDPEKQVVYPIILQTTKDPISETLQKIQWIDYRTGVRNLDELGKLLPYPDRVLRALAMRPMGRQLILPPSILVIIYFWAALAMFNIGACLPYVIQFRDEILSDTWSFWTMALTFTLLAIFAGVAWFGSNRLIRRKGLLSSWGGILTVTMVMAVILYGQIDIVSIFEGALNLEWGNEFRGLTAQMPIRLYWIGNMLLFPYLLWKRHDLNRWFPAVRRKKAT